MKHLIIGPLNGQFRLWVVFWLYFVLGGTALEFGVYGIASLVGAGELIATRLFFGCMAVFAVYIGSALWQCAPNTDYWVLTYAARFYAALCVFAFAPLLAFFAVTAK